MMMNKEQLTKAKELIELHRNYSFEYQSENGFDTIFDQLDDLVGELEKMIDEGLTLKK